MDDSSSTLPATEQEPISPVSPIVDSDLDYNETLGALTPLFNRRPYSNMSSNTGIRRSSSLTAFSGAHSFTTEDLSIPPQEASGLEFKNVGPGMIQMIRVPGAGKVEAVEAAGERGRRWKEEEEDEEEGGRENRRESVMSNGEGGEKREKKEEEEEGLGCNKPYFGRKAGTEIYVNGELYMLYSDGVLRPKPLSVSITDQFKGYAVRSNGIFKLLGGSPAAIDISTLYRVTPTGTYSPSTPSSDPKPLHRIKPVQQLLEHVTNGDEERMYVYDVETQGFIPTKTTTCSPPEEAIKRPGDLRSSSSMNEGDCEELFASAERVLRKSEKVDAIKKRRKVPSIATQATPMPFQPTASSPLAGPAIDFPLTAVAPAQTKLARQVSDQSISTTGGQGQGSWLNIDLPLQRRGLPAPPALVFKEEEYELPPVPMIPEAAYHAGSGSTILPNGAANVSIASSIGQWSTRFSPRNTVNRILGGGRSRTPQHADLYAPVALQQLVNECVLVLCVYGNRKSRDPRIARMTLPNIVSADFDDMDLFLQMRIRYNNLRGFWRRTLSLRGLRRIAVVEYHRADRHVSSNFQGANYSPTKLLECYMHPYKCSGERYWVEWAHRLSLDEDRYALEFVEEWRSDKVILAAIIPLSLSIISGVVWSLYGPDQNHLIAFVLAILVIVVGWSVVALMAVVSYLV